ncbi:MAG: hypothetical protein HY671_10945 [Chloroflexi bacterium]|nr:hypothetical protein [Chloroflexota bacterium]
MNRPWFSVLGAIVVVMASLAISPAPALADRTKSTPFSAAGFAWQSGLPAKIIAREKGAELKVLKEPVDGLILSSNWAAFSGASLKTTHSSEVTLNADGSFTGELKGAFQVIRPDGSGTLNGVMEAKFSGAWVFDPSINGPLILTVSDKGSWKFTGGTGSLAGTGGKGKWGADMSFGPLTLPDGAVVQTLRGELTFQGTYSQNGRDDDDD